MYTKEPPRDLQIIWHKFVANNFQNKNIESIIDIGSGRGKSKERLQKICCNVVTQDINNALMNMVDIIDIPEHIEGVFDLVTAFDVIEHIPPSIRSQWIFELFRLSGGYIFISTPNGSYYDKDWCFRPDELLEIVKRGLDVFIYEVKFEYFIYEKNSEKEDIIEVSENDFLNSKSLGLGLSIIGKIFPSWFYKRTSSYGACY